MELNCQFNRHMTITLYILLFFASYIDHAIYLSLIELDRHEDSTEMVIKVFTDDFQDALKNHDATAWKYSSEETFPSDNQQLLENYFETNLEILSEEEALQFEFIKGEKIGDSYQLTFQFSSQWSDLSIRASYFTELFPMQQNILIATYGDQKSTCRLSLSEPSCNISF